MQFQDTDLLDWYVYNVNFAALAPAGIATANVAVEADANFILVKLSGFADIAAAAQTYNTRVVPLVTLQITDTGSGRQLFNGDTAWSNVVGWGEIPYILPVARKWKANSTIRVQATNFDVAATYNLRLSFSGIKDFGTVLQTAQRRAPGI
jgi:hypothetical protein